MKLNSNVLCVDDSGAEGEFFLLDRSIWKEARKIKGDERGQPFIVQKNGIIKLSRDFEGLEVRVYIKGAESGEAPKNRNKKTVDVD